MEKDEIEKNASTHRINLHVKTSNGVILRGKKVTKKVYDPVYFL